jgi:hypothetical protein
LAESGTHQIRLSFYFYLNMTLDWQTTIVAFSILGALAYVGRRGVKRLRSFGKTRSASASCDTGCGKCDGASNDQSATENSLVQIKGFDMRSGQNLGSLKRNQKTVK